MKIPKRADPHGLLQELLAKDEDPGARPHAWVMGVVYELADDDEAQRIAAAHVETGDLDWRPSGTPARVEGPYCAACGKMRGPLAETTPCAENAPAWLRRSHAAQELELLPRSERRRVMKQKRRAERKERVSR